MNMYAYFKKNFFWIFIILFILLSGSTATLGYFLANSRNATREINAKYKELQRISDEAEATSKRGLDIDRELIERAGENKRRVEREYKEVSATGKELTQELQEIIEESARVEYRELDNGNGGCYYVIRATNMEGTEVE